MAVSNFGKQVFKHGSAHVVQALTDTDTGTTIAANGVTTITNTSGDKTFSLAPPTAGLEKYVLVDANSTGEVSILTDSTSTTLFGTTHATITFSTGAGRHRELGLVGLSTASWGITVSSTGITTSA